MKLTDNEKIIVTVVLKSIIDNAKNTNEFDGIKIYNTDKDYTMSLSSDDFKTLKRALKKIEQN